MSKDEIRIFEYFGKTVRTIIIENETWWVAKDICNILEHSDTNMAVKRLDKHEKGTNSIWTPGGKQELLTINESGLYSLIFNSRKTEAKRFKKWVTGEVLPSIRKTGQYSVNNTVQQYLALSEEDRAIAYFSQVKKKKELEHQLELSAPKIQKYDEFLDADGYMTIGDAAKVLNIGRNKLFEFLRRIGILMNNNTPYQKYRNGIDKFKVIHTTRNKEPFSVTLLTPKGFDYIADKVREKFQTFNFKGE
ncbi:MULTISPECIES: phage antirepressor KilAC domain-containing protein [unclassified Paenibacillus]|uniref:BRO family protein n=1 Tax=unclassified Paenibacillus TaxID=185978 RepID=UPI00020D7013|nr:MULTISPECIES: phage antirepressor KilAC domain-containing protein [unclassified Paenibacillus]EGL20096.1 BRO family, N-terminal domain protein [Paenibacillus sp. HGF7]EPD82010.1 hypothetical protein HMPREF1207_03836 [Paenibacillus sp. HGH0039]